MLVGAPGLADAGNKTDKTLTGALGLSRGQQYSVARTILLRHGWLVDVAFSDSSSSAQYGFKEVVCGNGFDAVCSARFIRKKQQIMVMLSPTQDGLLVQDVVNDL